MGRQAAVVVPAKRLITSLSQKHPAQPTNGSEVIMKPTMKATTSSSRAKPESFHSQLEQEIRSRAYELYQQRGRADGHDLDDWLQAESELIPLRRKAISVMSP